MVGLACLEVRLGEPDASGRRRPIPVSGSGFNLRADTIVSSIGQEPYLPFLGEHYDKAVDRWGNLATDEKTGVTKIAKVFAGGDVSTGPATVIEGIGAGHRAAAAIRRFVEGGPGALERDAGKARERWELGLPDPPAEHHERVHAPERPLTDRDNFDEVEWALSEKEAREEASRCLRCGPCSECWHCVPSCARRHVLIRSTVDVGSGEETLDLLLRTPREGTPVEARAEDALGDFVATDHSGRELDPVPVSIALVKSRVKEELCRGCGRCVEVCAFHAPRLVMGPRGEPVSRIDETLCRGCGLCVSVCQTGAAEIEPFSKSWILGETDGRGMKKEKEEGKPGRIVVITCQRRGGCITPGPIVQEKEVDVLRLSCVGQIEAGTILKLIYEGADRVIVAGCAKDRCRFESGAGIGHDQVELARTLLRLSGYDPERVQSDWSEDREGDPLPLEGLVTTGGGS